MTDNLRFSGKIFVRLFLYASLAYFTYLMLLITLQYIPLDMNTAFLRIKQDEVQLKYYRLAFFVHVYTSFILLFCGFTQFSDRIRINYKGVHRFTGRLYIAVVLLFSAPSGFVMGIHANGGVTSQLGFCILSVLWFAFTLKAYTSAKAGDFVSHRKYMWRSFALTLSAISLRLWKWIIVWLFEPAPMDAYRVVAWLGWVINLLLIEIYLRQQLRRQKPELIQNQVNAGLKTGN